MTTRDDELSLRRVLVALEAGIPPQDILETAAELATCLEASLMGLLIEDEFLHGLAELPIAREVALGAADLRSLTRSDVASHYALQAQRMRRDLDAIARRRRLECQFQIQRGIGSRLGELATRQDLLAMALPFGKLYRPTGQEMLKSFLQSKARALLALPARPQRLPSKSSPLVMLGDPGHAALFALARRIARQWESSLHLISTAATPTKNVTSLQGGVVHHRLYKGEEPSHAIRRAVRRSRLILLSDLLAEESLRSLASLETPLLILRQDRPDR